MALFRCLNPAILSSVDGAKVLTGELEPTSTIGTNGDIYLQISNKGTLLHFDEDFTDEGGHTWTVAAGTGEVSDEQSKFGGKSLKLTAGILQSEDDDGAFIPGKEDFTVSLWVYPTVTSRIALFATQGTGIAMDLHYNGDANLWASSTGNSWNVIQSDSASAVNAGNGTITVNTNEWTHIAYVRKGGKCMSFVNGVLSKEVSISKTADLKGSGQFNLGGWDNLSQYKYTGYIDDFMYIKGTALWDSAFTPPTEPMTLPTICKKAFRKIDNTWVEIEGTNINELGSFENPYAANLKVLNGTATPSNDLGNDGDIYLQGSRGGVKNTYGQFINTGYSGNNNSEYHIEFTIDHSTQSAQYPTSFGARSSNTPVKNASYVHILSNLSSAVWGATGPDDPFPIGYSSMINKIVVIDLKAGEVHLAINNTNYSATWTPETITETTPIGIFDVLINGAYQNWGAINGMTLFNFEIRENDQLVHKFMPAKDSNDVACVYDEIAEEYKYVNTGTLTWIEPGIIQAYQKVNGEWQSLLNSPINEKTIVEPMSLYSGSDAPTSILGKDNDLYLRNLITPITFDDWTSQNEAGMSVTTTANDIQITYGSGNFIGAYACKKIDFTNIKSITFKLKSGSHTYDNYDTKRFCPFLYLSDTAKYAVDTDADTPLGLVSRITADDTEITDTFDTSDVYGEKYLIFNSSGCTSTLESITFTYFLMPQIKINGSWQNLADTSIEDIFFAKPIPAGIYGYTQLSYIKSDGDSYINSKLRFTTDTEFEIGGRWNDISSTAQIFFGVWTSGGESLYGALQGKHWAQIGGTGTANAVALDSSYHIFSANANGIYIDENSVGTPTWSNVPTGYDIPILARQDGDSGINCQATNFEFGYCKIWQGGNLIRDFVPCKRNYDNAIGLYDKANNKFYQNNGTGEIIAGPAIPLGGAITYKNYVHFTDGIGFTLPFTINPDYKITVVFNDTVYKLGNAIIENTADSTHLRFGGYQTSANNSYYSSRGSQVGFWGTWSSGTHTFICNNGNNHSVFDGIEVTAYTPTTVPNANIHLGGGDIHGEEQRTSPGTYISRFKIESLSTGEVICDLRPAIQGQSTHCMYDIINDIAYTSSGLEAVDDIG